MPDAPQLTELLNRWIQGDRTIEGEIVETIYSVLHALAVRQLAREGPSPSLQPTALVNEAFLKLVRLDRIRLQDRQHFFALASLAIRRILVSRARRRLAVKRGGGQEAVGLEEVEILVGDVEIRFLDLNRALEDLEKIQPRAVRVVEMRYFTGLSVDEIAEVSGRTRQDVQRDWSFARAWLYARLGEGHAEG